MITPPKSVHPDDQLIGPWQARVAELLAEAQALIPTEAHWKCRANLGEVVNFWMFLPAPELEAMIRKRNRAAKNTTLTMDLGETP